MEVTGLVVGVAPLASLCLEILERARDFKEYKSSSLQLNARFELTKTRLKRWTHAVGLVNGSLRDPHHPLLDQPDVKRVVGIVLHCLFTNFGGSVDDAEIIIAERHRQVEHTLPGWKTVQGGNTNISKNGKSGRSGRNALLWATGHKAAFTEQVDIFEILVERLHEVVPLDSTERALSCTAEALKAVEFTQKGMLELVKTMHQEALLNKMRHIDEWLDAPSVDQDLEKHIDARLQGTCDWLFKEGTYLSWEGDDLWKGGAKVFWLCAPPGHGKTVLTAAVAQHMLDVKTSPTAYFFASPNVQSMSSANVVIQSWISQLTRANSYIFELVHTRLATSIAQKATRAEVQTLFRDILLEADYCTLVLDGYDEFARLGDVRRDFLQQLKQSMVGTKSRLFLSSRPEDDIEAELLLSKSIPGLSLSSHRITSKDLEADVSLYSRKTVTEQLPGKDQTFQQELADVIASKCDGMFLWIKLQKSELRDGKSKKRLREVVDKLPDGLTQSYVRTWNEIMAKSDYDRQRAIEILRWTCFAIQPLTVMELTEALVHGYDATDLCGDDMPDAIDDNYIDGEIKGLCGSLIEVRKDVNTQDDEVPANRLVHLVHISAREFLVTRLPPPLPIAAKTSGATEHAIHHMQLAEVCLRYLICDSSWKAATSELENDQSIFQSGLMKYAATTWYKHWQEAKMMTDEYKSLTSKFFASDSPHFDQWARNDFYYQTAWTKRKQETGLNARLYMAILFELPHIVDDLYRCGKLDFSPTTFSLGTALSVAVSKKGSFFENLISWGADINVKCGRDGSVLGAATTSGNLERMKVLLQQGADTKVRDWTGKSILTLACWKENLAAIQLLLDYKVDPSDCDNPRDSPLAWCITKKNPNGVRLLLDHGANLTHADGNGISLLHHACGYDNVEIVNLLLDRGADMLSRTREGGTPLHVACNRGQAAVVKVLLEREPNLLALVGTCGDASYHPIHYAAASGNVETIRVLMAYGADIKMPTRHGVTALRIACMSNERGDVVDFLLENGAEVMSQETNGATPLHTAAVNGLSDIVRILLKRGADVRAGINAKMDCWQPIHCAARSGDIKTLHVLLDYGADVNTASTIRWETPLHSACIKSNLDMIKFLVEKGADLWAKSSSGFTPWDIACRNGNMEAVTYFLERGGDVSSRAGTGWTPLHSACGSGNLQVVNLLLQKGADLSQTTKFGKTPLHIACLFGSKEIVALLIDKGADILQPEDERGCAPLHLACQSDREDIVEKTKLLLEKGADVNQQAKDGSMALHLACSNKNVKASRVVSLLLERGAEPTRRTITDVTPLHWAAQSGNLNTIKALLERGAQLPGQAGLEADFFHLMHFAVKSGKPEMVQFLIEKEVAADPRARLGITPLLLAVFDKRDKVVDKLIDAGADVVSPLWHGETAMDMIERTWPKHEMIQHWRSKMKLRILPHDRLVWLKQQTSNAACDALLVDQYPNRPDWRLFKHLAFNFWRLRAKDDFVFASQQISYNKNRSGQNIHKTVRCDNCHQWPITGDRWVCFTCPVAEVPGVKFDTTDYCGLCKARLSDLPDTESRGCAGHDMVLVPCYEGDEYRKQDDRAKDPEVKNWLETVVTRYKIEGPMPPLQPITESS